MNVGRWLGLVLLLSGVGWAKELDRVETDTDVPKKVWHFQVESATSIVCVDEAGKETRVSACPDWAAAEWKAKGWPQGPAKPALVVRSYSDRYLVTVYTLPYRRPEDEVIEGGASDGAVCVWDRKGRCLWESRGKGWLDQQILVSDAGLILAWPWWRSDGQVEVWTATGAYQGTWQIPVTWRQIIPESDRIPERDSNAGVFGEASLSEDGRYLAMARRRMVPRSTDRPWEVEPRGSELILADMVNREIVWHKTNPGASYGALHASPHVSPAGEVVCREGARLVSYSKSGQEVWARDMPVTELGNARVAPGGREIWIPSRKEGDGWLLRLRTHDGTEIGHLPRGRAEWPSDQQDDRGFWRKTP